jgi:hypothetical protein
MLDYLDAEIEKRKAMITKFDAESERLRQLRHDLTIELKAYENIRLRYNDVSRNSKEATRSNRLGDGAPQTTLATEGKRTKLAANWRVVLHNAVERYPQVLTNREIPEIQQAAGHDPSPLTNIRTYLHKMRQEGFYDDAGRGAVRATQIAAEFLGIPLGSRPENQQTETRDAETLFDAPKRETAGQSFEASPAVPFHHSQGGPNGTALTN